MRQPVGFGRGVTRGETDKVSTEQTEPSGYEKHWRWYVVATLFLATFLNYFDRQTLSVAMEPIAEEFGLDNAQRGDLLGAFILPYAICHLFIGFIADRVRSVLHLFPVMVVWLVLSTIAVAFASTYEQILGLRYLLGVWEAANFPVCLMIVARIFPRRA